MLANHKVLVLACLLACRALAVPVANTPKADIQAVIDTLKAELDVVNPAAAELVYPIELQLKSNGVLSEETIIALDTKLKELSPKGVLNTTLVADTAIDYLDQKGAFDNSNNTSLSKATTLTMEMISSVLRASAISARDCPGGERLCGGCVIL